MTLRDELLGLPQEALIEAFLGYEDDNMVLKHAEGIEVARDDRRGIDRNVDRDFPAISRFILGLNSGEITFGRSHTEEERNLLACGAMHLARVLKIAADKQALDKIST